MGNIRVGTRGSAYANMITNTALFGSEINGLSFREKDATHAWKWGEGKQLKFVFKSETGRMLRLSLKFTSPFAKQHITIKINGNVIDKISHIEENVFFEKEYNFQSASNNTISLDFRVSSKDVQAFPEDRRDLTAIFYELLVTDVDVPPPSFSTATFVGKPVQNALLAQKEYAEGRTILRSLPPIVTLALTTFCNNRLPCLICDRNTRPPVVDCEVTDEIIAALDPVLKTARYVLLHCGGEPMFSKYFDKMMTMIAPPTRISFATNGMLMTPERTDLMLQRDIMAGIVVSLDAATPEIYRIMRPSGQFERVIENIKYYVRRAKELGRDKSTVTLNMTVCEANVGDVPKLIDLALEVGAVGVDFNHLNSGNFHKVSTVDGLEWDYVEQSEFKNPSRHDRCIIEAYHKAKASNIRIMFVGKPFISAVTIEPEIEKDLLGTVAFEETEEDIWKSTFHRMLAPDVPSCFKPWRETVIQPDGDIRVCYFHDQREWAVSNILHTKDFMSIWNSESMVAEREAFLQTCFSRRCIASAPCLHRRRK
jgi:MoaA/NifB/PqqE/SkfB family radical SAM enzyme